MNCKKWRMTARMVSLVGILLFIGGYFSRTAPLWITGAAVMAVSLVLFAVKSRCPACGRYLPGSLPLSIVSCPYCGADLGQQQD